MDVIIITAIVALIGSASGIFGAYVGARISASAADRAAKSAERRHFRELGMQFALVNYEGCVKMAERASDAHNRTYTIPPLKAFVIQGIKIMEIVSDTSLNSVVMAKKIADVEDFAKSITDEAQRK